MSIKTRQICDIACVYVCACVCVSVHMCAHACTQHMCVCAGYQKGNVTGVMGDDC